MKPGVVIVAVLALAACGSGKQATFTNPVYRSDFPDPFVLKAGDTYYAYATNGAGKQVQTLTSQDVVHWQPGPDALPKVGSWGFNGETWAPEVLRRDDGSYVLYYTANHCVGRAVARKPLGPFVDPAKQPLVCQQKAGGSIDPSPFRDGDGKLYLLWKNDGNAVGARTYIYAQRLSPDGLRLEGKRTTIEKNDVSWEANVVEGPMLRKHDGRYFLFYSGNVYSGAGYAVGYATCDSPLGPCKDAPENPILKTACEAHGPGHNALIDDGAGSTWIVYHAWDAAYSKRQLWIDRLEWKHGKPVVDGPTCVAQDAPKP